MRGPVNHENSWTKPGAPGVKWDRPLPRGGCLVGVGLYYSVPLPDEPLSPAILLEELGEERVAGVRGRGGLKMPQ